jgi:hypothetical protein
MLYKEKYATNKRLPSASGPQFDLSLHYYVHVLCFDVFKPSKLIGIKSTMKVKY